METSRSSPPEFEEKILKFWRENKIFERSLGEGRPKTKNQKPKTFVFYDGPPFATGLPHYGHILASIIKDVIPRYKTMRGFRVPRRWGWDCHGLPIENLTEQELGLKTKKDIEKIGVEKFNEAARNSVLRYADEWKKIIPRIGRWVDMENDYKTMDANYTESVWWVFKSLFDKGLIYESYKSMHICPRCETALANFEVSQGYKDITDISVYIKFKVKKGQPVGNRMSDDKTYFLAWTTTPWTLPGNVALAVGKDIEYAETEKDGESLLYAENSPLAKELGFVRKNIKGHDLIGLEYEPLFDYYAKDRNLKNSDNGWRIYGADFVSTEEGTGVVHIAPAFGENDMNLGKKHNLPFIQHVSMDGKFKTEIKDFAGMSVKPKENHQSTDIEIIKWLANNNKLFSKQKITHAYPHCWRCETPLLNYAAASWFVKVGEIKNKLIANNKKINWIPFHIRGGRFGKWLEGARDWAISRARYWGAPLPVWKCEKCGKKIIVGSIEEIKKHTKKSGNRYFALRHGEAEQNVKRLLNSKIENNHYHLTKKGIGDVFKAIETLEKEQIDLIFSSDFLRAKETTEIVAEKLNLEKSKIVFDKRLREADFGSFDGKSEKEYHDAFPSLEKKFYKAPSKGETLTDLKNRVTEFLYEISKKYSGKNILIVSHEYPIWMLFAGAVGADAKKAVEIKKDKPDFIKKGEIKKLDFVPLPHNRNYELDLHRPYIDEIELECECGGRMKRIPEVFDCWFESGAMPYASAHFPFAEAAELRGTNADKRRNKKKSIKLPKDFPAEFIAEGLDQTRGWFYTLLILSTGLFNKPAYKNVVVNGIILAEDGQKMSKRLKNYPDPTEIVSKYGADSLRYYLLSSPAVRAEDLNFSEKGVDEVYKKVVLRLWNVYKFYEIYAGEPQTTNHKPQTKNLLDKWIMARLEESKNEISKWLDKYELDKATRPINDFVEDLSTWYIRRSRDRFAARGLTWTPNSRTPFATRYAERGQTRKTIGKDRQGAVATTKFVLLEFSKFIAPFMPFMAEEIYLAANGKRREASVHLQEWPKTNKKLIDKKLLAEMAKVRKICSLGLEARQKAGIKVRQPLASLKIKTKNFKLKTDLSDLIKDELNVKKIAFDGKIESEIELDIKITPELKAEGLLRELARIVQGLRKEAGFAPKDKINLWLEATEEVRCVISQNISDFKAKIGAKNIVFERVAKFDAEIETKIDDFAIWVGIKRI